jgi:CRP/FNR family cyclic AMP-dependent transcriptional regulator
MTAEDEIQVPKGTVLFRQGDPAEHMFVVAEGRVRITLGAGAELREIGVLGPGEFFGELSLLSGMARSATAETIEDSRLLVVGRDAFAMLVQDDLNTVARMLSEQGARLSRSNEPIQDFVQRMVRVRVIAHALRNVGSAMRVPWGITVDALAADLGVAPDALGGIIRELVANGGGTLDAGTWSIADHAQVDTLIASLATYASDGGATPRLPVDPFSA